MENNWKEKAQELVKFLPDAVDEESEEYWVNAMIEAMNLVFEATKKECAEKAELDYHNGSCRECGDNLIDKESILNINKPNL